MALFKSQVLTQASGSVGGLTYTRARGGLVMRARAVPTDPNTGRQGAARAAMTGAVTSWLEDLTDGVRANWNLYAGNVPTTNRLGDQIFLSGQNMYVRSYTIKDQLLNRLGISTTAGLNAPTVFDLGTFTTPTFTADASAGINVNFTDSDAWCSENDAFMLIFMGKPCNPTRNYFRGPYSLIGAISGDNSSPPSSPFTISAALCASRGFPLNIGQCVNLSVSVLRGDNRYSTRRKLIPQIVVA
jgi:hypothetical protein